MQSTFSAVSGGQDNLQFDEDEDLEVALNGTSDGSSERGIIHRILMHVYMYMYICACDDLCVCLCVSLA